MKAISTEIRTIDTGSGTIQYTFERKNIKNINLRIRHDGQVYVSAPESVPQTAIDAFVTGKKDYIFHAITGFQSPDPPRSEMQYVSGENVTFLGKNLRIKIEKDSREYVSSDGIYVYIHVKRPDYYNRKKNLLNSWLDEQRRTVFQEIMQEVHGRFSAYNVGLPALNLRSMTSRWGSCQPSKGIITLNSRLIEAPKSCIAYVLYHEFCHFVYPNHSKQFYALLQVMLPDWRERKALLESSVSIDTKV